MGHVINDYRFGRILIDGNEYKSDVKIFPERVENNWWRLSGHSLNKIDIEDILQMKPDVLLIGTGSAGTMDVPVDTIEAIRALGIKLIIERTAKACEIYNNLSKTQEIVTALHLTC